MGLVVLLFCIRTPISPSGKLLLGPTDLIDSQACQDGWQTMARESTFCCCFNCEPESLHKCRFQYCVTVVDPALCEFHEVHMSHQIADFYISAPPGWPIFLAQLGKSLAPRCGQVSLQNLFTKSKVEIRLFHTSKFHTHKNLLMVGN